MFNIIKKFLSWDGFFPGEQGFVGAAMVAAPYILKALSALGGVFGKKKKYVDPEELKKRFGAGAITGDAQQLANFILSSPYGQELLGNAAESGQGFERNIAERAAASGMGPGSGAESGASIFASGAASQAQNSLERGVRSNVLASALPIAASQQPAYMQQFLANNAERNAEPSIFQRIAGAAGQAVQALPVPKVKKPGEEVIA